MKNYERPVVLANEDLAEGVYAASGAVSGSGSVGVSSVELTGAGSEWYPVNTYAVTVLNSGSEAAAEWSVSVSIVSGKVKEVGTYSSWFANVALNGNQIVITPNGNGGFVGEQEVQITVKYEGDPVKLEGEK